VALKLRDREVETPEVLARPRYGIWGPAAVFVLLAGLALLVVRVACGVLGVALLDVAVAGVLGLVGVVLIGRRRLRRLRRRRRLA
jgi:Flp pilus assembly protein TadB